MDGTDWEIVLGFGGIAATVIASAVVLFVQTRTLGEKNERAHADIGENINRVERELPGRIDQTTADLGRRIAVLDRRDQRRARAAMDDIFENPAGV
jgi:hypothetical protein